MNKHLSLRIEKVWVNAQLGRLHVLSALCSAGLFILATTSIFWSPARRVVTKIAEQSYRKRLALADPQHGESP